MYPARGLQRLNREFSSDRSLCSYRFIHHPRWHRLFVVRFPETTGLLYSLEVPVTIGVPDGTFTDTAPSLAQRGDGNDDLSVTAPILLGPSGLKGTRHLRNCIVATHHAYQVHHFKELMMSKVLSSLKKISFENYCFYFQSFLNHF